MLWPKDLIVKRGGGQATPISIYPILHIPHISKPLDFIGLSDGG